jgi:predicted ATPase
MQDDYLSLTRVRLRQYRSIAAADVRLGRLTFLVGPNGSGKSNFLDALRLVADALGGSLDEALAARGGIGEVRRKSTGHPTRFTVDLSFQGAGRRGEYGIQVAAVRGGGFRVTREQCSVWTGDGTGTADASFRVADGVLKEGTGAAGLPAPDRRQLLLSGARESAAFGPVLRGLASLNVVNLSPQAMRLPQPPDPGTSVRRDGSNLPAVLLRLGRSKAGREDRARIESYLREIVPGVHSVSRTRSGDRETVEFVQDVPGSAKPWRFTAQSVSDGTLRALGVLACLFTAADGAYGPLAIEEPETALHPAGTRVLLQALRDASDRRQIIATSHSPDLLDHEEIGDTELLAVRSAGGLTTIGPLEEPAAFALRAGLDTPGELLRTGRLHPQPGPRVFESP